MSGPRIIISRGLWGRRTDVTVEPPRSGFPLRTFADHAQAMAFAYQLSAARGWEVRDECQPQEREA